MKKLVILSIILFVVIVLLLVFEDRPAIDEVESGNDDIESEPELTEAEMSELLQGLRELGYVE